MAKAVTKSENTLAQLESASDLYLHKAYGQSADIYESLIKDDPANPLLKVNLANCHFKMGDYGKAILNYYQAKAITPRNKELNNNLSLVFEKIELSQPPLLSYSYMNLTEAFILVLVFNILFVLRKKLIPKVSLRMVLAFAFILVGLNFLFMGVEQKIRKFAVVNKISVQAYSGDDEGFSKLFELFDGQVVEVINQEESWSQIKYDENLGWIKNDSMGII